MLAMRLKLAGKVVCPAALEMVMEPSSSGSLSTSRT